jgi:hypothetical protein
VRGTGSDLASGEGSGPGSEQGRERKDRNKVQELSKPGNPEELGKDSEGGNEGGKEGGKQPSNLEVNDKEDGLNNSVKQPRGNVNFLMRVCRTKSTYREFLQMIVNNCKRVGGNAIKMAVMEILKLQTSWWQCDKDGGNGNT